MKEVFGLDEVAWKTWVAYRKKRKKPLPEASMEAAMKRLASFGDQQMEAVLTSIANGWQGVFPPGKKAPSVVKAEEKAKRQVEADKREMEALTMRAQKVGYRTPLEDETLADYRYRVERRERDVRDEEYRKGLERRAHA
jgi:hypothetical protein